MKKILGLDLGTTSVGWAYVHEAENDKEVSEIIDMGVRIVPLTSDEENDFAKGNTISVNADRTLKEEQGETCNALNKEEMLYWKYLKHMLLYLLIFNMQKMGLHLPFLY